LLSSSQSEISTITGKTNHSCGGKRIFLGREAENRLTSGLHSYFRSTVDVSCVKRGKKQEIESLINEEAMLLARYLRGEKENWIPRIAPLR